MGKYKFIERFEDGRFHLYDVAADPGEKNDLAPHMRKRALNMRRRLHRWYREVDAKFLEAFPGGEKPWRPGRKP